MKELNMEDASGQEEQNDQTSQSTPLNEVSGNTESNVKPENEEAAADKTESIQDIDSEIAPGIKEDELSELDDIIMLKMGRHFRLAPHLKIIIGREEGENHFMQGYKREFVSIFPTSHPGALCLVDGEFKSEEELTQALDLVAR